MEFQCRHCMQSLEADTNMAGMLVVCPRCSRQIQVPPVKTQPIRVGRATPPPVPVPPASELPPLNTGLQPRSFLGTAAMIFGVTALPFGLLSGWLMSAQKGVPFGQMLQITIPGGLMFGLLFGLITASFMKGDTATFGIGDRDDFVSRINIALSQIGYHPATASGSFLTFKPSFQAGLMSGRISVLIRGNTATVVGPALYVRKLQKRLI